MKRMLTTEEILQITKNKTDIESLKTGKVNCYEATNLTTLTKDFCNKLKAGDVVLKKTGSSYHAYRVSFKKDSEGLCLTYTDAGYMETVSYDKSGTNWVYNSTDVVNVNRLEQIVDADGHNRFYEGVISLKNNSLTPTYLKFSLSGSHLMIVCAFKNETGADITLAAWAGIFTGVLPEWIMNKIYPIGEASQSPVAFANLVGFDEDSYTLSSDGVYLYKDTYGNINTSNVNAITIKDGSVYRIQFDLIIDNA